MASLEELNNIVQTLQQTIHQQQEKNNNLEKQLIEYRQDILVVENNLSNTQQQLAHTNQELAQTKQELERFNALIDKLKGANGETLKFACGSTNPDDTDWKDNNGSRVSSSKIV